MNSDGREKQRVLITGATGFVGRSLCTFLTECGYVVRGTYRHQLPINFPVHIEWKLVPDIDSNTEWKEALEDVDCVVHLAALAHQMGVQGKGRFDEFMRINAAGTERLAQEICESKTVKRLIFISTIGVVKSISDKQLNAETVCMPENDYGKSKYAAELAIQEKLKDCEVDWCILRPTLVYGPGNPGNMERLLKLINMGIPLPLGAVKNRRSFIYIGNFVDAIEKCLSHPNASRKIFLVSDNEIVSTPELIRILTRYADKSVKLITVPSPVLRQIGLCGDVVSRFVGRSIGIDTYSISRLTGSLYVDSTPIKQTLGWAPPFSLEEGLKNTLRA